jgi:3-deoxy-alpha-D-manno-octulosonate 8-oxidase
LEYGKNIKMAETAIEGVGIDTPEDLVKANAILKNKQH